MENYKKNVYSQNGEDGLIEYLLSLIPDKNNWCCEFGAWDGKYLSNTFNLVENKDYKSVYIEADEKKYLDLLKTAEMYENIIPKNKFIDLKENSLDNILSETKIPYNFDVLSIDIDGVDYAIWKSLVKYKPKIVIIEINSSLDPEIIFHPSELTLDILSKRTGVNFMTCYELGKEKGYTFFYHTGNMIFLDEKYKDIIDTTLDPLSCFNRSWLPR
jgi:hypothetical protein